MNGEALIGTCVLQDRYRIEEEIGGGAMGVVYRACQLAVDRDVAIKVLRRDTAAKLGRRFEVEARIISQLRHPNTLKLIEMGRDEAGRLFIVTDFLRGETLDDRLRRAPLTQLETVRVLRQIADSIGEAHALSIIHRDLKPANVFLERIGDRDVVRVLDFGIAKLIEDPIGTTTGNVWGTPGYMSPEQLRAAPLDGRSDLYAVGVIGYRCLSGRPPFVADNAVAMLLQHVNAPPEPPSHYANGVDAELEAVVLRCLAKSPNERFASASQLRERLETIERRLAEGDRVIRSVDTPTPGNDAATAPYPELGERVAATAVFAEPDVGITAAPRDKETSRRYAALILFALLAGTGGFVGWQMLQAPVVLEPPPSARVEAPPPEAPVNTAADDTTTAGDVAKDADDANVDAPPTRPIRRASRRRGKTRAPTPTEASESSPAEVVVDVPDGFLPVHD